MKNFSSLYPQYHGRMPTVSSMSKFPARNSNLKGAKNGRNTNTKNHKKVYDKSSGNGLDSVNRISRSIE